MIGCRRKAIGNRSAPIKPKRALSKPFPARICRIAIMQTAKRQPENERSDNDAQTVFRLPLPLAYHAMPISQRWHNTVANGTLRQS